MCPPVTSLQGTPPFQNFPGLPITLRNKCQVFISADKINEKRPFIPSPPHLLLLFPLLTLLHCQHAMPAPASGPLHCFTHCLECSSPNSLQAYSLIPSSSLLKCHLLTHLNSFLLLPTQHPSPALFSSWHRQCQHSNLCLLHISLY